MSAPLLKARPPQTVANNAQRGLDLRREYGRGGTATGIARARDLSNRANISLDTLKRMKAFFDRHEQNKDTPPEEGNGKIAWLLWGGDAGRRWAESQLRRAGELDKKQKTKKDFKCGYDYHGFHAHGLIRQQLQTFIDGKHQHCFIVNGQPVMTYCDGEHRHTLENATTDNTGEGVSAHQHEILLPDGTRLLTERDGEHGHSAMVRSTGFDGEHQHVLTLPDGTEIESLTVSQALEMFGMPNEMDVEAIEDSSRILRAYRMDKERDYMEDSYELMEDAMCEIDKQATFEPFSRFRLPNATLQGDFVKSRFEESSFKSLEDWVDVRDQVAVHAIPFAKRAVFMKKGDRVEIWQRGSFGTSQLAGDSKLARKARMVKGDYTMDGYFDGERFTATDLLYADGDRTQLDFIERRQMLEKSFGAAFQAVPGMQLAKIKWIQGRGALEQAVQFAVDQERTDAILVKDQLGFYESAAENSGWHELFLVVPLQAKIIDKSSTGERGVFSYTLGAAESDLQLTNTATSIGKGRFVNLGRSQPTVLDFQVGQDVEVRVRAIDFNESSLKLNSSTIVGKAESSLTTLDVLEAGRQYNLLHKSAIKELLPHTVGIVRKDEQKQIVYGVVLEPETFDLQDDIISAEEIEETAHGFMRESRVIGLGHTEETTSSIVESYIAPIDMELGEEMIRKGSWVLGVYVEDAVLWNKVLEGELMSFSIGGFGLREPVA